MYPDWRTLVPFNSPDWTRATKNWSSLLQNDQDGQNRVFQVFIWVILQDRNSHLVFLSSSLVLVSSCLCLYKLSTGSAPSLQLPTWFHTVLTLNKFKTLRNLSKNSGKTRKITLQCLKVWSLTMI